MTAKMKITEQMLKISSAASDAFFSFFLISVLVIFYWRGTWILLDVYLFPKDVVITEWISFAIGNSVVLITTLSQKSLSLFFGAYVKSKTSKIFASRVYLYVCGLGCVNQWRGIWLIIDYFTGKTLVSCFTSIAIGYFMLNCIRCFITSLAAPSAPTSVDIDYEMLFFVSRKFNSKVRSHWRFFMDSVLNLIIMNLVVSFWRGVWTCADILLEPNDIATSGLYSVFISVGLSIPVYVSRYHLHKLSRLTEENCKMPILKIVLEILYITFAALMTVLHWRGLWLLQDVYILPQNKQASAWLSHAVGSVGLLLLLTFRNVIPIVLCDKDLFLTSQQPTYIKQMKQTVGSYGLKSNDLDQNDSSTKSSFKITNTTFSDIQI